MKLENSKIYRVEKYSADDYKNYGQLPGSDVKSMLKGYKYDAELEMWFSKRGTFGYSITEVKGVTHMKNITATFKNGCKVVYTDAVYGLLTTDADVVDIMDNSTGEILFAR